MAIPHVANAQKAVDTWLANNPHDMEEIMTWTGDKFNKWHFANMKKQAAGKSLI